MKKKYNFTTFHFIELNEHDELLKFKNMFFQ